MKWFEKPQPNLNGSDQLKLIEEVKAFLESDWYKENSKWNRLRKRLDSDNINQSKS